MVNTLLEPEHYANWLHEHAVQTAASRTLLIIRKNWIHFSRVKRNEIRWRLHANNASHAMDRGDVECSCNWLCFCPLRTARNSFIVQSKTISVLQRRYRATIFENELPPTYKLFRERFARSQRCWVNDQPNSAIDLRKISRLWINSFPFPNNASNLWGL